MKWIKADELAKGGVTKRFHISALQGGMSLGIVKWHPGWRRFAFFPNPNTLYESECLRDLAEFCETETAKRKEERKAMMAELAREEAWTE